MKPTVQLDRSFKSLCDKVVAEAESSSMDITVLPRNAFCAMLRIFDDGEHIGSVVLTHEMEELAEDRGYLKFIRLSQLLADNEPIKDILIADGQRGGRKAQLPAALWTLITAFMG